MVLSQRTGKMYCSKKCWVEGQPQPQPTLNSQKDNLIIAQCLTKCATEIASSLVDAKVEDIPKCVPVITQVVWSIYSDFLKHLNE